MTDPGNWLLMAIALAFLFWLTLSALVGAKAGDYGRNQTAWFLITFFTGLVGAVILLLLIVDDPVRDQPPTEAEAELEE